ncbi:hypothetical protein [Photobacterium lutimaris]|uniref:Uncharacterized protein n=1 Tax=Photobacterium lutimaris TaxID=388278 RepID=A0A2T3ITL7_9GAMM|nr:hypothetical protein [Photobacterium lutimaris]PSU31681.1 hypothetical protein C9I99_21065 [Photobacterium lutimaris]
MWEIAKKVLIQLGEAPTHQNITNALKEPELLYARYKESTDDVTASLEAILDFDKQSYSQALSVLTGDLRALSPNEPMQSKEDQ